MSRSLLGSILLRSLLAICVVFPAIASSQEAKKPEDAPIKIGKADKERTGELPELTTELGKRAALAFAKKDWVGARKLYGEVLQIDPENALALANLGAVAFQLRDYKSAQNYLEKAVANNPKLIPARVTLGMAYYYAENYYMAISSLTRAVHDDPKNSRAHMYLAVVAKQAGWNGAAEEELRKAIAVDPDYPEAHYNLALIYVEQKPPAIELARRHYYKALELGAAPDAAIAKKVK